MGRDRMRVLVCGIAAIALIVVGALMLDWFRLAFEPASGGALRIAIDLRDLRLCHVGEVCVRAPLTPLPGMFPTLAAVTMWSSLGVAAVVAAQAGFRILTGSAYDSLTKVGYMMSLMAISIAVATAYMFGPETEGSMIGAAAQAGVLLQRTWAPATLIVGLVAGFATLYMAVAPESSDLTAAYKPVQLAPRARSDTRTRTPSVRIPFPEHTGMFPMLDSGATGTAAGTRPVERKAVGSTPIRFRHRPATEPDPDAAPSHERRTTDLRARPTTDMRAPRTRTVAGIQPIRERTAIGSQPIGVQPTGVQPAAAERTATGTQPIGAPPAVGPSRAPAPTGDAQPAAPNPPSRGPASDPPPLRERAATGVYAIPAIAMSGPAQAPPATVGAARERISTAGIREPTGRHAARDRPATAPGAASRPAPPAARPLHGQPAPTSRPATGPTATICPPTGPLTALPAVARTKTGPIVAAPPRLRHRLSYVVITAELTAGGIDARREDGLARLVLWRDVVGVVARRMPAAYDGLVFVDVVSTAGSTLRIVPWTRLAGEPIVGAADDRPRRIIEHVAARCPGARIDPATRQFLDTGTAAQIPDLETLRAHDERLA